MERPKRAFCTGTQLQGAVFDFDITFEGKRFMEIGLICVIKAVRDTV